MAGIARCGDETLDAFFSKIIRASLKQKFTCAKISVAWNDKIQQDLSLFFVGSDNQRSDGKHVS